ncbi:MAG TPA: protein kinase, partial [Gemmatimonadales bacterium]|nr:protein kinase [Gemmatimonadales bacterium]
VHRDLKPGNVMLGPKGQVKVLDFGLAKALEPEAAAAQDLTDSPTLTLEAATARGVVLGTAPYMSPEQARGQAVDARTDVWAFGCLLYEMLTGRRAFAGDTVTDTLVAVMAQEPDWEALPAETPPLVRWLLRRCLDRDPDERLHAIGDVRLLLAAPLAEAQLHQGEAAGSAAATAMRWKRLAVAMACGVLVLAVALAWSLLSAAGGSQPRSLRHTSIVVSGGDGAGWSVASVAISPDGSRVVYAASAPEGEPQLWTRSFSDRQPVPIPGTNGAEEFFLSPDGEWVGFYVEEAGEIRRVRVSGGEVGRVARVEDGGFWGGTWGPDQTIVFATRSGLHRVPAAGGMPSQLTTADPERALRHRQPDFLPSGDGVVFTVTDLSSYPGEHRIALLPFDGEPAELVVGHSPQVTAAGQLVFGRGLWIDGSLWAATLEREQASIVGRPVRVLEGHRTGGIQSNPIAAFALAEDGTLVYLPLQARSEQELVWVDRAGAVEPILGLSDPQLPPGAKNFHAARLSPDGTRIAFTALYGFDIPRAFRLFVYDLRRGVVNPVTVDVNADWPVWTPDGERLVFNRFTEQEQSMYWAQADNGDTPEPLIPPNPLQQHAQHFSPDGRFLVLQQREVVRGPDSDIWILPMTGQREPRPVVAGSAFAKQATVSPDGRWLAFVSDDSGQDDVYVTDFPDGRRRIKVSTEPAFAPVWNPAGGELFFRRGRDAAVMAAPVTTDPTFSAGPPAVIVEEGFYACCVFGRSWDVAPDGRRFLMSRRPSAGPGVARIDVVQNWLDHVKRRLGARGS